MGKSILQQLKENERETRRKIIITAAKKLFKKISFHKIGMRTIANETGISVASLYQYFPSQDDLFVEILKNDFQFLKNKLWTEKVTLDAIATDIVDFFVANEDTFQMMSYFMIRGEKNPEILVKFNKAIDFFLDLLDKTLTRHNPEFKKTNYSRAFFTALFGNIISFRNTSFSNDSKYREDLYKVVRITAKVFQESFSSESELKNSA